MKHKILTLLLLCLSLTAGAQSVDPVLMQLIRENRSTVALGKANRLKRVAPQTVNGVDTLEIQRRMNVSFNRDGSLRKLCILGTLADGAACPKAELEALGIRVCCTVGRLVIMDVPAEAFAGLAEMKAFRWLAPDKVLETDNFEARRSSTVSVAALEQLGGGGYDFFGDGTVYDGSGVVLGVIDLGIDFNHVAFRTGTDYATSRIKEAITFTSASNIPVVTTGDAILGLTTGNTSNSHGTHTSATAGGSYLDTRGVAPGADLVLADCSNTLSEAHIIASAQEIVRYATEVGKPCVISVSLGSNDDFHDGSPTITTAFNSLTSAQSDKGRIICVSSSNAGSFKMSIQKTLATGDTLKTVMKAANKNTAGCSNYPNGISCFAYSTDGQPFSIGYKAVDVTSGTTYTLEEKPLMMNSSSTKVELDTEVTLYPQNNKYGVEISARACHFTEANLHLAIFITPGSEGQKIVMSDHRAGNDRTTSLEGATGLGAVFADYTDGNADMSINVFACTDGVISVGAYTDRKGWQSIDADGNKAGGYYTPAYNRAIGSVAPYSSYGVDDNGVRRPDIVTPGTYIQSAYNIYDKTVFVTTVDSTGYVGGTAKEDKQLYMTRKVDDMNNRVHFFGAMSGTSMATPVAAGIVALWLQAKPTLTTAEVRNLLQQSAAQDKFTVVAENTPAGTLVQAGRGKMDAVQGLMRLRNYNEGVFTDVITMKRPLATYYNTEGYSLDLRNPGCGIKAYKAIYGAEQQSTNTVLFKRCYTLSAGEAFLLTTAETCSTEEPWRGTAPIIPDPYEVYPTTEVNRLYHGVTEDEDFYAKDNMFVLSQQDGVTAFYPLAAAVTAEDVAAYKEKLAGKGVLVLAENAAAKVKAMAITLGEENNPDDGDERIVLSEKEVLEGHLNLGEDVTGIGTVEAIQGLEATDIYDLQGRKVTVPGKGLYIMGGRKVMFSE